MMGKPGDFILVPAGCSNCMEFATRIATLEAERDRLRNAIESAYDDMRWNADESAYATLKYAVGPGE